MDRTLNFRIGNYFYIFLIVICEISTAEVPRPRGVSLSRALLYNPEKDFNCFDGSLTIPFTQVNDDYCDCPDASDEPGTAACPHGIFHCTNAGHKPLNIASSRVNDGICDCCDASDEYANHKGKCINNCKELGRTAREEAQKRAELIKAGKQLRAELSEKGIQLKQEMKEKLTEYQKNRAEADKVLQEKEAIKKQIEEVETAALQKYKEIEEQEKAQKAEAEVAKLRTKATETFNRFDSNQDGVVDVSELQTRNTFDRDRNGEVSEEEAKYFLNDKDGVELEEFINISWNRIKPFLMMDAGMFKPPAAEGEEEEEEEEHHEDGEHPEEEHQDETPEGEEGDEEAEHEEGHEDFQEERHEDEHSPEPPQYDDETMKLIDQANAARDEFSKADSAVKDILNEIKRIEDYLGKDFGPDEEFASLQGQCFEYTDYEYIYKLCPFDQATQQPKSGGSETRLGAWSKWNGPADNKYSSMLYDKGQSCWNGPSRSTVVTVNCGSENQVTSVSEPNRCEYQFDFITPAACSENPDEVSDDVHDEL